MIEIYHYPNFGASVFSPSSGSSIRTTEQFYAHYSPEFAINRAREVMETRGRQMGDTDPKSDPPDNPLQKGVL